MSIITDEESKLFHEECRKLSSKKVNTLPERVDPDLYVSQLESEEEQTRLREMEEIRKQALEEKEALATVPSLEQEIYQEEVEQKMRKAHARSQRLPVTKPKKKRKIDEIVLNFENFSQSAEEREEQPTVLPSNYYNPEQQPQHEAWMLYYKRLQFATFRNFHQLYMQQYQWNKK